MAYKRKPLGRRFHRRQVTTMGLNITAMMDMFTIILVFLLKSYTVSYVELKPHPEVQLPVSHSQDAPQRYVALDITPKGIFVENELLQPLENFNFPQNIGGQETLFGMRTYIKSRLESGEIGSTIAVIRADRQTPYDVLWRIMYTLRQLGFEEFQNLTIKSSAEV